MKNFIKQFNAPKRLGLYKVLASNVDQGVGNLKSALQNGQRAEDKATPQASQVAIDDLLRTAVDREDQLVEELISLDEADVLHTISLTLIVDDGDALHTAPVVIEELDDLEEEVTVLEEGGILIVYLEDLFDAADAQ